MEISPEQAIVAVTDFVGDHPDIVSVAWERGGDCIVVYSGDMTRVVRYRAHADPWGFIDTVVFVGEVRR